MRNKYMLSALLAVSMLFVGCSQNMPASSEEQTTSSIETTSSVPEEISEEEQEGKVLNIYSNNDVLMNIVAHTLPDYIDNGDNTGYMGDVKVVWKMPPPNADYNYNDVLRYAIEEPSSEEERIDMFVVESDVSYFDDYLEKYALPLSDIGIIDADTADMYDYTLQLGTFDGELKGLIWEAAAGVFAYRRSIAKEVLGTDEPSEVQKYVADWDKFTRTAELMKQDGYYMHISSDETIRLFKQSSAVRMQSGGAIVIDGKLQKWAEQSRLFMDKGYITDCSLWSDKWAEVMVDGTVFGCFMPTWGVDYTIPSNVEYSEYPSSYGDWAICEGPAPYFWGGTMLCVTKDTDDKTAAAEFIRSVFCNAEIMERYACIEYTTYHDTPVSITLFPNNRTAAKALCENSDNGREFLGGQNPYSVYAAVAEKATADAFSCNDGNLIYAFQRSMDSYISGESSYDEALEKFFSEQ